MQLAQAERGAMVDQRLSVRLAAAESGQTVQLAGHGGARHLGVGHAVEGSVEGRHRSVPVTGVVASEQALARIFELRRAASHVGEPALEARGHGLELGE